MAMTRDDTDIGLWTDPHWDIDAGALAEPPARYGAFADEPAVRFLDWSATPVVTVPLAVPERDYINVIAELATGLVVGIQIDALEMAGVKVFPHWSALLHSLPPREAVAMLVADVRALFDRYGVDLDDSDAP